MNLQAGMATDKAYSRKLEAKLSASKSISDLHARCSQYKLKLRELAQELQEAESRTESVQEMADVRADEVRLCIKLLAYLSFWSFVCTPDTVCCHAPAMHKLKSHEPAQKLQNMSHALRARREWQMSVQMR